MARLLSRTLIRTITTSSQPNPTVSVFRIVRSRPQSVGLTVVLTNTHHQQRHRSSQSGKVQLIEVEIESPDEVEVEVLGGIRKLEEVIQSIIVRRSAPDWLPFIPGSSYWVPPRLVKRAPYDIVQVIRKMASTTSGDRSSGSLCEDEAIAVSSDRGWPSSAYFIERTAPTLPIPVEVEIEVKIYDNSNNPSKPETETDDE